MSSKIHAPTFTETRTQGGGLFSEFEAIPALLLAHAPSGAAGSDIFPVGASCTVGRAVEDARFAIACPRLSQRHFRVDALDGGHQITDLGSSNGTFVNGRRITQPGRLEDRDVIRAGSVVAVFCADARRLLAPSPGERFGIEGRFFAAPLVEDLREAALSARHVLLTGPSGCGKELAARALAEMMKSSSDEVKFIAHNAARFSSPEEASTTLFGVGAKVFSSVAARSGLIEQAHRGVLFLDEMHNLPERLQRSLLRVLEDGELVRIGESNPRPADVQFILASNESDDTFGLAHDLFARLRRYQIPSLEERRADIPSLFIKLLERALKKAGIEEGPVVEEFGADHFETLCLDSFEAENVRGLVDVADRVVSALLAGKERRRAVVEVFNTRFADSPVAHRQRKRPLSNAPAAHRSSPPQASGVPQAQPAASSQGAGESGSHYEAMKDHIVEAFKTCGGNLSATERLLKRQGLSVSRKWLRVYTRKWGLKRPTEV